MEVTAEKILTYWPIIAAIGGFLATQVTTTVIGYVLLRKEVTDMKAQINGVGNKLNVHAKDMETKFTALYGELKHFEGYLKAKAEKST